MPIEIEKPIVNEAYDFCARFTGTITPADISSYFLSITDTFDSWDDKRALVEFLPDVRLTGFNFAAISALSRTTREYQTQLGTSSTALVAPNAAVFGFARMYMAVRNPPYTIRIFRARKPAILWLSDLAT